MQEFKKFFLLLFTLFILAFTTNTFAFSFKSIVDYFHPKQPTKVKAVSRPSNGRGPAHVKVGIYVLHVGKYDLQSATYLMDFYLIFKCDQVCQNINFEIMNATNSTVKLAAKQKGALIYRVQAELTKSNNLRNYPFDNHTLDIILENRQMINDKMIFEPDFETTALDPDLEVAGFYLLPTWSSKVISHYYPVFKESYSSYKFTMFIERPWLAGLLKGILPAFIIVCCNFLALFMGIQHLASRLGIATSTLVAAVVFHLNLTSSLPPLGYITFADTFMLLNYLCLLVVLVEVVITSYYVDTKHHESAVRVNRLSAFAIPILWLVLQIINWLVFNPITMPGDV